MLLSSINFKVRVYILNCQNLTAVDNSADLHTVLAGGNAMCSADPYPVITIGSGYKDPVTKYVRQYNDRDKPVFKSLNPQFYRSYELDAVFPDDWKLTVEIYD